MNIFFLKLSTLGITQLPTNSVYYSLTKQYNLVYFQNSKIYVNVLTTKPFGKFHKIADYCIDPKYKLPQYIMDQSYIIDPKMVEFKRIMLSDQYLIAHMEKFKSVLIQIDYNNAINLIS